MPLGRLPGMSPEHSGEGASLPYSLDQNGEHRENCEWRPCSSKRREAAGEVMLWSLKLQGSVGRRQILLADAESTISSPINEHVPFCSACARTFIISSPGNGSMTPEYKAQKEASVSFLGGGGIWEINHVALVAPVRQSVAHVRKHTDRKRRRPPFCGQCCRLDKTTSNSIPSPQHSPTFSYSAAPSFSQQPSMLGRHKF